MYNDFNLLQDIKPAPAGKEPATPVQDPHPLDGAIGADNVDTIDKLMVDFSEVEAQHQQDLETQNNLQIIGSSQTIDQTRAAALESHIGPLLDKQGARIVLTAAPSRLNYSKALESAVSAAEVRRVKTLNAIGTFCQAAQAAQQAIEKRKTAADEAAFDYIEVQRGLMETFGSGSLTYATQQVDGQLMEQYAGSVAYLTLGGSENYEQTPILVELSRKIRLSTAAQSAIRTLFADTDCLRVGDAVYRATDLTETYYVLSEDKRPDVTALVDAIGTAVHVDRIEKTYRIAVHALAQLAEITEVISKATAEESSTIPFIEQQLRKTRSLVDVISQCGEQLVALTDLFAIGKTLASYLYVRRSEQASPATESAIMRKLRSFCK